MAKQNDMVSGGGMTLLPAKEGTCSECATEHAPELPHNRDSLYYGVRFKMQHGREPTWIDALAHCDDRMKSFWEQQLREHGVWPEKDTVDEK